MFNKTIVNNIPAHESDVCYRERIKVLEAQVEAERACNHLACKRANTALMTLDGLARALFRSEETRTWGISDHTINTDRHMVRRALVLTFLSDVED